MRIPWRFILALPCGAFLSVGLLVALLYVQLGVPTESSHWAYELIQKKEALAAAIPGPRLLIVAGSGALYGINAQLIQQQTGFPTINLATHAGLGLDYIFYRAKKTVHPGDTVLLAIEYELYLADLGFETHDDYILARDPSYFRRMSWSDKIAMATRIPFKRIQKGLNNWRRPEKPPRPHVPYNQTIDDNGDELANEAINRQPSNPQMQLMAGILVQGIPSEDRPGFIAVREFVQWAGAHHIRVLATFPNTIYRPEYDEPTGREAIKALVRFYTSQNVPVIGTAREAMLPEDDFFDTFYHLTHEAALQRTERLIPELRPYLSLNR